MNLNRRSTATALLAVVLGTTLAACSPNGSTTPSAPEPAPISSTAAPTPTPTIHVAIEVSLEGDSIAWADVVAIHERGDKPVLWLTPEAGASLTLTGSSSVYGFSTDGGMEIIRNAEGDAVFSPKISAFDGSVVGSGGEVCADGSAYFCFQVKAVQP